MKALKEKNGNPMHLGKHVREVQVAKAQTWSQSAPQVQNIAPIVGPEDVMWTSPKHITHSSALLAP